MFGHRASVATGQNLPKTYAYFPIWAEEGGVLQGAEAVTHHGGRQWAFGNGNESPLLCGPAIPFECELIALTLTHEANASCEVECYREGVTTGRTVRTNNSMKGINEFETNPVTFQAGDVVGFQTVTGTMAVSGNVVTAWFRRSETA